MRPEFAALETAKHVEHILALNKAKFAESIALQEGMNSNIPYTEFLAAAQPSLEIAQRAILETDPTRHQLLPYAIYIVLAADENEPDRIVLYRRSKVVGEEKLLGNYSIGFGGHPEFIDVHVHTTQKGVNLIDLRQTIDTARSRELAEEISITLPSGTPVRKPAITLLGLINDNSDEVGTKHLGIASIATLPEGTSFVSNEPNQEMQGDFTIHELLGGEYQFESWTRICLEAMAPMFNAKGKLTARVLIDATTGDRSIETVAEV